MCSGCFQVFVWSSFEIPIPKYEPREKPSSAPKLTAFNFLCDGMEDDFELCTVKKFYGAIEKCWWYLFFENGKNKIESNIFLAAEN